MLRLAVPNLTRPAWGPRSPPRPRAPSGSTWTSTRPCAGDTVSEPIALCEVRGWAGTGLRGKHDVIIVLDRSGSTFRSSGMDVDGDGVIGRDYSPTMPRRDRHLDLGLRRHDRLGRDARRAAADRAARPRDHAHGHRQLRRQRRGRRAARAARARSSWRRSTSRRRPNANGTYMYGALEAAIDAFEAAPAEPGGPRRQREILLLTDGVPTAPPDAALRGAAHRGAGRATTRRRRTRASTPTRSARSRASRSRTSRRSCARTAASCSCSSRRARSSSSCPTSRGPRSRPCSSRTRPAASPAARCGSSRTAASTASRRSQPGKNELRFTAVSRRRARARPSPAS